MTLLVLVAMAMLALATQAPAQASTVAAAPAPTVNYAPGGAGKVTGIIISRQGDDILIRDGVTRAISTITLVPETRITSPTGFLNLDRKSQNVTSLIPGLAIVVNGSGGTRGNLIAHRIGFHKSSLRVASQISAGEVDLKADQRETAERAQSNSDSISDATRRARGTLDSLETTIKQRMSELDTYDVKLSAVVNFPVGSAVLSDEAKSEIGDLVNKGLGLTGYIIEVAGFASAEGTAAFNQRLSERRADAVVEYLTQVRSVPLRRIVNPTGLGTSNAVASNDSAAGRAENRRVEVKVLVNRALNARQ
jgi:outer membrane protein OmpA-like peptidoglycan-associated protein